MKPFRHALASILLALAIAVAAARPAGAQLLPGLLSSPACVTVTPVVSGGALTAAFSRAGLAGTLSITFEDVAGLDPGALSIAACVVNTLDPALRARLGSSSVGVALGLPVLLRIGPAPGSSLAFHGTYDISVYTTLLSLVPPSPFRLFKAPDGGPFRDTTAYLQPGSLRAGSKGSSFSEFLVVADLRPVDAVIGQKLDDLEATLAAARALVPPAVHAELAARLAAIRALVSAGDVAGAMAATGSLSAYAAAQSGTEIPDLWQASGGAPNVGGTLRAQAATLLFSLGLKPGS